MTEPQAGRKVKIGELVVDAQTGEVLESGDRCRVLQQMANTLLGTSPPAPLNAPAA